MTTEATTQDFRTLGPSDLFPVGLVVARYLSDVKRRVSVARVDGQLYAFDDLCRCEEEQTCPLSGGLLTGTILMCQCHGTRFDISTGAVVSGFAIERLRRYDVREVDGTVQLAKSGLQ